MIATQGVWLKLSAPIPNDRLAWRQDGKVHAKDGKFWARFVVYVEANTVRERLDSVVPGEWNITLDLLPSPAYTAEEDMTVNFKARLQILGVIRENVGTGKDYKSAATDAFKRAAVGFGIGSELYDYEQNWVPMDGDGKNAKPLEDPQSAYQRRFGTGTESAAVPSSGLPQPQTDTSIVSCPKCGGRTWDNRLTKKNPRAPDYKCQNRSCDGVIWPEKKGSTALVTSAEEEIPF